MAGSYADGLTEDQRWAKYHAAQAAKTQAPIDQAKLVADQQAARDETANASAFARSQQAADADIARREAANNRAMTGLQGAGGSIGGGGAALPPPVGGGYSSGGGPPASVASSGGGAVVGNEAAARAAAFARAKDTAGQVAQSSLRGLREALGSRGMLGGGAESSATAQLAGQTGEGLQEVNREQMISDYNRAGQIGDRDVQAGLTQRGQDITQRGQDITANLAKQQSLLGLMNAGRLY